MKLVAVMGIDTYRDDLHRLYRAHAIQVFSEIDIRGHYHADEASASDIGWFGHSDHPAYSTLTWAFVADDEAQAFMDAIAEFNTTHDADHRIRAFQMDVERAV